MATSQPKIIIKNRLSIPKEDRQSKELLPLEKQPLAAHQAAIDKSPKILLDLPKDDKQQNLEEIPLTNQALIDQPSEILLDLPIDDKQPDLEELPLANQALVDQPSEVLLDLPIDDKQPDLEELPSTNQALIDQPLEVLLDLPLLDLPIDDKKQDLEVQPQQEEEIKPQDDLQLQPSATVKDFINQASKREDFLSILRCMADHPDWVSANIKQTLSILGQFGSKAHFLQPIKTVADLYENLLEKHDELSSATELKKIDVVFDNKNK